MVHAFKSIIQRLWDVMNSRGIGLDQFPRLFQGLFAYVLRSFFKEIYVKLDLLIINRNVFRMLA